LPAKGWEAGPRYCHDLAKARLSAKYLSYLVSQAPIATMAADAIRIERRPRIPSSSRTHAGMPFQPRRGFSISLTFWGSTFCFRTRRYGDADSRIIYSLMVNANINGVGHNFIHNPFSDRNFSIAFLESLSPSLVVFLRRCTTPCICNITRGTRTDRMNKVTRLIGYLSTGTATRAKRKIRGATCF